MKNTLSANGGVTGNVYSMADDNSLTSVVKTKNTLKTADGADADGVVLS